jgi:hypothetical protein
VSRIRPEPGERLDAGVRRRPGTGRAPGSVLIAVAAWLAPQAGLQPGTARSYLYAELDGRAS